MSRFEPHHLAILLLCIIPFGPASAAERHVPAHYPTIQQAVNAAVSGDIVRIAAGHYTEQVVVAFKTGLTLSGEPGTVLHAFPEMQPLLAGYNNWPYLAICAVYRSDVVVKRGNSANESELLLWPTGLLSRTPDACARCPNTQKAHRACRDIFPVWTSAPFGKRLLGFTSTN